MGLFFNSTATGRASNGGNLTPCGCCGSYGLAKNPNQTTKPPCAIPVDANGDRKPSSGNINCNITSCAIKQNVYKVPLADEKKISDIFVVLITDKKAIPYGVTAQRAMYQAQK